MTILKEKLSQITNYIDTTLNEHGGIGAAVSIVKDSEIVFSQGFGHSQIQPVNKSIDEDTMMSIQSISKNFMALSIMQLVEDKKVSLHDPVVRFLPYFRTKEKQQSDTITIRHILSHTAGFPADLGIANMTAPNVREIFSDTPTEFQEALDHYKLTEEDLNSITSREDITRWFENVELEYPVGKGWNYCTDAYVILADLFEKVTGECWETQLRDSVLTSLNMERTTWKPETVESDANSARYYLGKDKVETPFPQHPLSAPIGYLYSSACDLAKYLLFHLNGEPTILRTEYIKEMQEPVHLVSKEWRFGSEVRSYGLAWFTDMYKGYKVVEHGGGQMAVRSLISMVPELNLGVVVLLNFDGTVHHDICDKIIDTFIDN
ncbi:beta-lactamase family protein [Rossellomorea vietnamensis]|uniref:Beta-lactamase family protein n=2 Tax=Rossellomorea TaxID=2837508 RepID=A0A5D4K8Z2_9BACI|nr:MULTISPECIES: serine hydrolase domain-containing protein [Rossellomorea]TYR73180.1 beta-lactamase family protein [Rossellomorea vietnamensis]TYS79659.1 beta-lactamase family protein [Rossellomorea aquimaris]